MKTILITSIFMVINYQIYAQFHGDNFDGNWPGIGYGHFIYKYDSTHNNVWQIGQPQKNIFNQARSIPNALMTDTINSYPINDTSILIVKVPVFSHDWGAHTIMFEYMLNTDSLNDFGTLEVSADGGTTYINVLTEWNNYGFWWNGDITYNFSGNTNDWKWFSICISSILNYYPSADTILYKFSFISDSIQTNKDGWIIDNLVVEDVTENIFLNSNKNKQSTYYIDNTKGLLNIDYSEYKSNMYEFEIFDINGKLIYQNKFYSERISIDVGQLKQGLYIYRINDKIQKRQNYEKFEICNFR